MTTPGATAFDEMVDGRGGVRPHWRRLVGALSGLGHEALVERAEQMGRALDEDGAGPPGIGAPRCDPVPLPLSGEEFAALEAGLAQRAALIARVLADAYGPGRLMADGILPPELVYPDFRFLRPCRGMADAATLPLHLYAADLARGPDGKWRVVADQINGADGIARALDNRHATARVMPEIFPPLQVAQLRSFLDSWGDALQRLAPDGEPASTALLTGGHADPMWPEHVQLARELSIALVEFGDLTVRDGVLHLKTLRGLRRVTVLLRRVPGGALDPLELASETGGVPGLLHAARTGALRVVNAPGADWAESAGLSALLPRIARHWLETPLLLPGLPSHWLGEAQGRDAVLRRPDRWVIRPATGAGPDIPVADLSGPEREALLDRVARAPAEFVATASAAPSLAPCVGAAGLEPRPVRLRLFALFDSRSWQVMPGGSAWTPDGSGKDVWVMMDEGRAISGPSRLVSANLPIRRPAGELPSRVAEDFFWLGRYLERAETGARLQRALLQRLARAGALPRGLVELGVLADILARLGVLDPEVSDGASPRMLAAAVARACRDGGMAQLLDRVLDLANRLRGQLSEDMHAAITGPLRALMDEAASHGRTPAGPDQLAGLMTRVVRLAATASGLAAENMVRGGGRLFLDLGRRLERAGTVAGTIAHSLEQVGLPVQSGRVEAGLRTALDLCDSAITYRGRYPSALQPAPVLDLVLADEDNPRSLAYQLATARDLLASVDPDDALPARLRGLLDEVRDAVQAVVAAADQATAAAASAPTLRRIEAALAALSDRVTRRYFALLPAARTMGFDG